MGVPASRYLAAALQPGAGPRRPAGSLSDLQPGDVLTFYSDASHAGIYVGDGMMIHSSTYGVAGAGGADELVRPDLRRPPLLNAGRRRHRRRLPILLAWVFVVELIVAAAVPFDAARDSHGKTCAAGHARTSPPSVPRRSHWSSVTALSGWSASAVQPATACCRVSRRTSAPRSTRWRRSGAPIGRAMISVVAAGTDEEFRGCRRRRTGVAVGRYRGGDGRRPGRSCPPGRGRPADRVRAGRGQHE